MTEKTKHLTITWLEIAIILICFWLITVVANAQDKYYRQENDETRIAVLENRQDQIDRHLAYDDGVINEVRNQQNAQANSISELTGELRVAGSLVLAMCGGIMFIQIKFRKKEE